MELTENILLHVQNLLLIADENGDILYVSPSVEKILGYSPEEMLGSGWWNLKRSAPGENAILRENIAKMAKGQMAPDTGSYINKIYTRSGKPKWMIWNDSRLDSNRLLGVGIDYSQTRKETMTQEVIFNISERANQTDDLDSLFRYMAEEIMGIFDTRNIYILLYDEWNENVKFPIYIDEEFPEGRKLEGPKSRIKGGLTEYTIKSGTPKLFSRAEIQTLMDAGELNPIGDIPTVWMGLPLKFGEKIFGLIALQDYEIEALFDEKDLDLMKFISREIASILERREQRRELMESEMQYRILTESLFEGIAIHNTETILVGNQAFCEMFGYTQEELGGLLLRDLATPEFLMMVKKSIDEKSDKPFEVLAKKRDGTHFWVETLGRDHMWKGKKVRLSAIRNIDQRKRAEEAQEEAKRDAKIKAMIQNSSEIISLLNESGIITFESASTERILGYKSEEREGKSFTDIIHPEDLETVNGHFAKVLKNPEAVLKVEYRLLNNKGKWRNFQAVMKNLLSDPLVGGILVSSVDITDRKRAEQKIKENEARTRTMVQHSLEAIVLIDLDNHVFTEVNPKAEKLFGYNRKELLTMGPLDLSPRVQENGKSSHLMVEENLRQVLNQGSLTYEWTHINKKGEPFSCEIRMVMLPSSTERIARASILDISERKRKEKERQRIDREVRHQKEVLLKLSQSKALISGDLEESISEIIENSGKTLGISRVSIWFFNESHTQLTCHKSFQSNGSPGVEGYTAPVSLKNAYFKTLEKERIVFSGKGAEKVLRNKAKSIEFAPQFAVMDSPIRVGGKMVGLVSFEDLDLERIWTQEEQNFATSIADLAALSFEAWERARAERRLLESEERFKTLFERSPDAIFVEDIEGNVLDVNEAACRLHETTREQLVGKNIGNLVPESFREAVLSSLPKWFSGEITYSEGFSVTFSGRKIPVEIHSGKVIYKGKSAIILQVRDITRRKEQEAKLVESREKLARQNKTLLDLAHNRPMHAGDIYLAMQEITKAAATTTRTDRVSIWFFTENRDSLQCRCEYNLNTDSFDFGPIIEVKDHNEYFNALATERFVMASDSRENELTRAFFQGKYTGKTTALIHAPIRSGGDILGMVSFEQNDEIRDWTTEELGFAGSMADLVALSLEEWKKQKAEEELLQRNFELDNFVYRASHDLKAPLNSVMGLISLIEEEDPGDAIRQYISLMNRSILKLEAFILDLADYSRNARLEITSTEINFAEMVRESVNDLSFMENADKTTISIDIDQKYPFFSDSVRISIILNNFISNAIKYQDLEKEKGLVDISVRVTPEWATIQITDNGLGIAEEYQDKIFNMFFRASVQAHGTGLGLYIVKDAIEKLKGKIKVQSSPGEGSTFTIQLPNFRTQNED
ncbi:MAG: PAS domain S-box protein [Bacteroidia bacterium]|nr:PAS domain S-box protein [Bacteroidia bacterium]